MLRFITFALITTWASANTNDTTEAPEDPVVEKCEELKKEYKTNFCYCHFDECLELVYGKYNTSDDCPECGRYTTAAPTPPYNWSWNFEGDPPDNTTEVTTQLTTTEAETADNSTAAYFCSSMPYGVQMTKATNREYEGGLCCCQAPDYMGESLIVYFFIAGPTKWEDAFNDPNTPRTKDVSEMIRTELRLLSRAAAESDFVGFEYNGMSKKEGYICANTTLTVKRSRANNDDYYKAKLKEVLKSYKESNETGVFGTMCTGCLKHSFDEASTSVTRLLPGYLTGMDKNTNSTDDLTVVDESDPYAWRWAFLAIGIILFLLLFVCICCRKSVCYFKAWCC